MKQTRKQQISRALRPFLAGIGMLGWAGNKNTSSFMEFETGQVGYEFNNGTKYWEKINKRSWPKVLSL